MTRLQMRVRQGRRQQHIHLPPSGYKLRHRVRPGIKQALQRIRDRADRIAVNELSQIATMKMDLISDEELAAFLTYPRQEIMISENVAADFHTKRVLMIQQDPGD
ncbi:hypothetical protein [Pseudomonas syringae]|uniref:hypothetical protein n=1 Tax=Pseudomonas syringae TaxID=317 RepID=UPI000401C57E|nr:hypothetical protein [Pseudomonas syringae]